MDYLAAMRAFVRAVDLGSFSKASDEMNMKVSTVSRYVGALEADLGVALLNRSTRAMRLTEAGAAFYDRSVAILTDVEDARLAASVFNSRPMGLLKVTMPPAFGRRHVAPHLKAFCALFPDIRLDLLLSDAMEDLIDAGIDVAIRTGTLPDSGLVARRLASYRRLVVASPEYIMRAGEPRRPEDLRDHQCLEIARRLRGDSWFYRSHDGTDGTIVPVTVSGGVRANDSEVLLQAARDGLGLALLPTWLLADDLLAGRLKVLLPDYSWFVAPGLEPAVYGVYPPKKTVSTKVRAFLEFFADRFADPPYWELPRP